MAGLFALRTELLGSFDQTDAEEFFPQAIDRHGYADVETAQVVKIIRKEQLKRDPESQALENVVAVVFVQHYLDAFVADHKDYDDAKLADILKKTLRKMDSVGHAAALALPLPAATVRLIDMALK